MYHRKDLELHQVCTGSDPLLQKARVRGFHQLEAALETGLDPAIHEPQALGHLAAAFPQSPVDGLRIPIAEAFDHHEKHFSTLSQSRGGVGAGLPLSHAVRPPQVAQQLVALLPGEAPEFAKSDLFGVQAGIRLDSPAQVRAPPRTEAVAASKTPHGPQHRYRGAANPGCSRLSAGTLRGSNG